MQRWGKPESQSTAMSSAWAQHPCSHKAEVQKSLSLFGVCCVNLSSFIYFCYLSSCSVCKILPALSALGWKSNKSGGLQPFSCKCLFRAWLSHKPNWRHLNWFKGLQLHAFDSSSHTQLVLAFVGLSQGFLLSNGAFFLITSVNRHLRWSNFLLIFLLGLCWSMWDEITWILFGEPKEKLATSTYGFFFFPFSFEQGGISAEQLMFIC